MSNLSLPLSSGLSRSATRKTFGSHSAAATSSFSSSPDKFFARFGAHPTPLFQGENPKTRFSKALTAAFDRQELKHDVYWGIGATAVTALFPPHLQAVFMLPGMLVLGSGIRLIKSLIFD